MKIDYWDIFLLALAKEILLLGVKCDKELSIIWDAFYTVKNLDYKWWWMRSSCKFLPSNHLDWIIGKIAEMENMAYIRDV